MKKIFIQIILLLKTFVFSFYKPKNTQKIFKGIPYFSQRQSSSLTDQIYNKKIDARQDPLWKKSGAKDPLEYLHWSWSICGIACLKMILQSKNHKEIPIIALAKNGLKYGFYSINQDAYDKEDYINSISDLKYKPFVKFINQTLPLHAKIINPLTLNEIIYYLDQDNFIIASVSSKIREPKSIPTKRGGHLVLILGYDLSNHTIIFHNPSGVYKKSQKYTKVSFPDFNRFFANKGIIIKSL